MPDTGRLASGEDRRRGQWIPVAPQRTGATRGPWRVIVECESVSLSRPVPLLLRPVANPIGTGSRGPLSRTPLVEIGADYQELKTGSGSGALARFASSRRSVATEFYFEQLRPELAGHEQPTACAIRNPVQDIGFCASRGVRSPFKSIQPVTWPVFRCGRCVRLPDVGEDFALDDLELVQVANRQTCCLSLQPRHFRVPGSGSAETRPVAHDQSLAVIGQTPPSPRYVNVPALERGAVGRKPMPTAR